MAFRTCNVHSTIDSLFAGVFHIAMEVDIHIQTTNYSASANIS